MNEVPEAIYYPFLSSRENRKNRMGILADEGLRRTIDIVMSAIGLLFLSPIFLIIVVLIKRDSPGPVFYRGLRFGRNGRVFRIVKFRTMHERPESYQGANITAKNDDRITPFGHWLRDTKINELPQLWNVLVGDMSLVGPRPEDTQIGSLWPAEIRDEILSVRPGLTSPASIVYRHEEKMLSESNLMDDYLQEILPSKLRLDLLYIRNRSVLTDLDVIFLTGVALLPILRNKPIPGHLMFFGPVNLFVSRFLNWFVVDFFMSMLSVWFVGGVWRLNGPINVGLVESIILSSGMALCFSLINLILRINQISWAKARALTSLDLIISACFSTAIVLLLKGVASKMPSFPNEMIVMSGGLSAAGFIVARYRERVFTGLMSRWLSIRRTSQAVGERVLIVGAGDLGEFAVWFFSRDEFNSAFQVIGFVDDNPRLANMVIAGKKIVGSTIQIPDYVKKFDIGMIIFAITRIENAERKHILDICRSTQAKVVVFPDLWAIVKKSLYPDSRGQLKPPLNPLAGANSEAAWNNLSKTELIDQLDELVEVGNLSEARRTICKLRAAMQSDATGVEV